MAKQGVGLLSKEQLKTLRESYDYVSEKVEFDIRKTDRIDDDI